MRKAFGVFTMALMVAALCLGFVYAENKGKTETVVKSDDNAVESLLQTVYGKKPENLPDINPGDWNMKLVNADAPVAADYEILTGVTKNGYLFDERAIPALDAMLAAGQAEGLQLVLTSSYRTYSYQDMLFQDKVSRVIAETGLVRADAEELAAQEVARPGTSEHNIGLAADIVCEYYGILNEGYADTSEAKWLREHCAEFGFILRYGKGKEDITKITYEPWHFRYVGVEAAEYIMENDLCLEEFLELYK